MVSPMTTPLACSKGASMRSQWLPCPSGISVAWSGYPASVPSTLTIARVGSLLLAGLGSTAKAQAAPLGVVGRSSLALKRMPPIASTCQQPLRAACQQVVGDTLAERGA